MVSPRIYCKCGCKGRVTPGRTFLIGHNNKINKSKSRRIFCKCGCREKVALGRTFIFGHNLRILSEKSKNKINGSRFGRVPWNKGLTKEIDERLAKIGVSISKSTKGRPKTEEHNRKVGIGLKRYHANMTPEEKEEFCKRCSHEITEEALKLMTINNRALWKRPGMVEKQARITTKLWQDPEYRKKQMDSQPLKKDKQSKSAIKRIQNNPRTAGGYGKQGYF